MALVGPKPDVNRRMKIVTGLAFTLLAIRLFRFIDLSTVNLLYWDQWDFLGPFFDGSGLKERFLFEHGPIREGLAAIVLSVVYDLSGWSNRVEGVVSGFFLVLAGLIYWFAKIRSTGRLHWADLMIPLSVLSLTQHELFTGTQNPAHGPIPALLCALAFWLLTRQPSLYRAYALAAVSVASTFTGFGFFSGLILPVLMGIECFRLLKEQNSSGNRSFRNFIMKFLPVLLSIIGTLLFFIDYKRQPAVECFKFPIDHPVEYLQFSEVYFDGAWDNVSRAFLKRFEMGSVAFFSSLRPFYLLLTGVFFISGYNMLRKPEDRALSSGIFYLASFTLVFALFTAFGRVCLGMGAALSSRYVPYAVPGILAIYFALQAWVKSPKIRVGLLLVLVGMSLRREIRFEQNRADLEARVDGKKRWAQCYVEKGDIAACDQQTGFQIYPFPEATQLQAKLDFLKKNRLNLFLD